jgi:uncharacterized membrane protein YphA (DoxX/SURF4 family)
MANEILLLVGRILFGGYFVMSGYGHFFHHEDLVAYARSKKVPMANLGVFITGLLIFLGGLGVMLGVYIQWSLWAIILFLLVVTLFMHRYWQEQDAGARMSNRVNFYKNFALLGAALMLLMIPTPWIWALF